MSFQIRGQGNTVAEVESTTGAMRVALRSDNALGAYGASLSSGTMAAGLGAGAEVFQFRWTQSTKVARIDLVRIWAGGIVGFTAGFCRFELVVARSWTADGSGGTAATMTGNNGKKRTSFATSLVGAIRIASTAALTAGTKTLDSQGIGNAGGSTLGSASAGDKIVAPTADLFRFDGRQYPVVLAQNEGLVVRATVPGAGTWRFGVDIEWTEFDVY